MTSLLFSSCQDKTSEIKHVLITEQDYSFKKNSLATGKQKLKRDSYLHGVELGFKEDGKEESCYKLKGAMANHCVESYWTVQANRIDKFLQEKESFLEQALFYNPRKLRLRGIGLGFGLGIRKYSADELVKILNEFSKHNLKFNLMYLYVIDGWGASNYKSKFARADNVNLLCKEFTDVIHRKVCAFGAGRAAFWGKGDHFLKSIEASKSQDPALKFFKIGWHFANYYVNEIIIKNVKELSDDKKRAYFLARYQLLRGKVSKKKYANYIKCLKGREV